MAEAIARDLLRRRGLTDVEVGSAGTGAHPGSRASEEAVTVAAAHGLDLSGHAATLLTEESAREADLILVMSPAHLMRALELGAGPRAALLTSYAGGHPEEPMSDSVPDPVGGTEEEYAETFRLLRLMIERVVDRLEPVLAR